MVVQRRRRVSALAYAMVVPMERTRLDPNQQHLTLGFFFTSNSVFPVDPGNEAVLVCPKPWAASFSHVLIETRLSEESDTEFQPISVLPVHSYLVSRG